MPFGLTAAGNTLQYKFNAFFNESNFLTGIGDDMIIWGEQVEGSHHGQQLTEYLCTCA